MRVFILAMLLLPACITPYKSSGELRSIQTHLYKVETQNEEFRQEFDRRSYRADMARCGRSKQCRVNTRYLWKRIIEDETL